MKHNLVVKGEWVTVTDAQLNRLSYKDRKPIDEAIIEQKKNPLAHFLAHGVAWSDKERIIGGGAVIIPPSDYPQKYRNDGIAFLNNWEDDIAMMVALNQGGKSFIGAAWTAYRVCDCDPDWPCFTENGIVWHPWEGPKTWVVASYSWDNVITLWQRYRAILPRHELGAYAPGWGKYPGERGRARDLSIGTGRSAGSTLKLACGSMLKFLCYGQQQVHWEGFDSDGAHFDEQPDKEKFIGWIRSTTTRGDYTPCCFTLTGHVIEGRPDTGAGGWIKRELWDGVNTSGKTVGRYHITMDSVPNCIISQKKRKELYDQWVNPNIPRSEKDARAAIARYWGGWEEGSGLVFESDCWDTKIHVIPPLWKDDDVPRDWTKWRVVDFGDNDVSACVWMAVGPEFAVCYRLLYERGLSVFKLAQEIITRSHNKQVFLRKAKDWETKDEFSIFKEDMNGEQIWIDLIDSRSAKMKKGDAPLLELCDRYGLTKMAAASGVQNFKQNDAGQIQLLKDWMRIDWTKPHPTRKNPDGTPALGAARLYFFEGRTEHLISELSGLQEDWKQKHHAIDACKYWASDRPRYMGDKARRPKKILNVPDKRPPRTTGIGTITGY